MKHLILALLTGAAVAASAPAYAAVKTIVLAHDAFADGSGWKPVADILQSCGYSVPVVQEPETSFAADVSPTRRMLARSLRAGRPHRSSDVQTSITVLRSVPLCYLSTFDEIRNRSVLGVYS
jgi:hypothetical protein